jgi:predicted ATPase
LALRERTHHVHELIAWRHEAAAGSGRMLFLGGEAGIGKTSLTQDFCRSAAAARVLQGA